MTTYRTALGSISALAFLSLALTAGCATGTDDSADDDTTTGTTASALPIRLGANGDACTVRTKPDGTTVPGTEKDGECCATADSTDCVIILKPFPKAFYRF